MLPELLYSFIFPNFSASRATDMNLPIVSLQGLPTELISAIVAQSDREGWKALRLVNHKLGELATKQLFREIHLSPNSHSFERAHGIVIRDHLAKHVKSLVYHLGLLVDFDAGFDAFRHEYLTTRGVVDLDVVFDGFMPKYCTTRTLDENRDLSEVTEEVLCFYSCWQEELGAQRMFKLQDECEELRLVCDKLHNLTSIAALLDDRTSFSDPQDYISWRTGMDAYIITWDLRFPNLFSATMRKALKKISARPIQWADMLELQKIATGSEAGNLCLERLSSLELEISNTPTEEKETSKDEILQNAHALEAILEGAKNLLALKLDFDELLFFSDAQGMLPYSQAIFHHCWPHLRELKLEAICTEEDILIDFFRAHAHSLRSLCLGNVELARPNRDAPVPSVLRMFQCIRESSLLTSCRITGFFANRIDHAWCAETEHRKAGCLLDQLEAYLCRPDTNIQAVAEEITDESVQTWWTLGERTDLWLHRMKGDYDQFCDDSWIWCPELAKSSAED